MNTPITNSKKGNEDLRFIYDKVYDEINRCRDWPVKILGFTSGLYLAVVTLLKIDSDRFPIHSNSKWGFYIGISIFSGYCIGILMKQHLDYLKYRNIQIGMQKKMKVQLWKVGGKRIIPEKWDNEFKGKLCENWTGWVFYAIFIICLSILSIWIICGLKTCAA
jgi:hypothetical protein